MKLSARELEIISDIAKTRRQRKIGAWLGLATALFLFAGALYFNVGPDALNPIMGVFLGVAVTTLTSEYSGIRTEDKLIDLLQRYVNSDPEAIHQLSARRESSDIAA